MTWRMLAESIEAGLEEENMKECTERLQDLLRRLSRVSSWDARGEEYFVDADTALSRDLD